MGCLDSPIVYFCVVFAAKVICNVTATKAILQSLYVVVSDLDAKYGTLDNIGLMVSCDAMRKTDTPVT